MIGSRLLHYEITDRLGEGGMGEVYRARDTKLDRDVAIKTLPADFVEDAERLARFEREAKVLASLNHPHIAAIYAFESAEVGEPLAGSQEGASPSATGSRIHFLVMELVDGEDLSERLTHGSIATSESLKIAHQIAEALQAAHSQGVVHRDLKPANVKVTSGGQVKVLDFGLAKAWGQQGNTDLTRSPTLTAQMTQAGVILGTASYMSPEQARAQDVDKRADIWSFGVVLYEMLVGDRIFGGDTVTDILGAIVHKDPDWNRLPADLPRGIHRLLHRCLEKDLDKRLQDIGDARIEIEEALEGGQEAEAAAVSTTQTAHRKLGWLPWAITAFAVALAAWSLLSRARPEAVAGAPAVPDRLSLVLPDLQTIYYGGQSVAISPDGRSLAYCATTEGESRLFVRRLEHRDTLPVGGTEGCWLAFFSPDGQSIGIATYGDLAIVPLGGGAPVRLSTGGNSIYGASWADENFIVLVDAWGTGMSRVPAGGGEPERLTSLDSAAGEDAHIWPEVLPGSEIVLYTVWTAARGGQTSIHAYAFSTGESRVVLENARSPRYSRTGHLLFVRGDQLMGVRFDPDTAEPVGTPSTLATNVRLYSNTYGATFDVSHEGTLVYQGGGRWEQKRRLVWVDREGVTTKAIEDERDFDAPKVSSDGKRIVVTVRGSVYSIWIYDLEAGTRTKLQQDQDADTGDAVWVPGRDQIVYWSNLQGPYAVYKKGVDGSSQPELVNMPHDGEGDINNIEVSPDGKTVVYEDRESNRAPVLTYAGLDEISEPRVFIDDRSARTNPAFSPDSQWLAYVSDESGEDEVHVAAFPGPGANWMISSGGGFLPRWSLDARELYYLKNDGIYAVEVNLGNQLSLGKTELLFESDRLMGEYDVAPDGRFLMLERVEDEGPDRHQLNIVLNWPADLP